jgi:hypothetical protein
MKQRNKRKATEIRKSNSVISVYSGVSLSRLLKKGGETTEHTEATEVAEFDFGIERRVSSETLCLEGP